MSLGAARSSRSLGIVRGLPRPVLADGLVMRASENLSLVDCTIVEVPAMAGDPFHEAAEGPAVLTDALAVAGRRCQVRRVSVPSPAGDVAEASVRAGRLTAQQVRSIRSEGRLPLVLAGSCDVAPAVLAGIRDAACGVVWIDAHADFNTPASSVSGFWPGMALAVVVGDCGNAVWSALDWHPVAPERVALLGVRSLTPVEEAVRLARSALHVVQWRDGTPQGGIQTALDRLAEEVDRVYVHLDLDALDPSIGSGVVDPPVPGGLSARQLYKLLDHVAERFTIAGATLATYTPSRDDGSTLPVAVGAMQRLLAAD
jgi:arginase